MTMEVDPLRSQQSLSVSTNSLALTELEGLLPLRGPVPSHINPVHSSILLLWGTF
jgi:hypothetical protein